MMQDASKTRHYRIHLSASNCTLVSIALNVLLVLFLVHSWSSPCAHIESDHMSALTPPAHLAHSFRTQSTEAAESELSSQAAAGGEDAQQQQQAVSVKSPHRELQSESDADVLGKIWVPPVAASSLDISGDLSSNASFSVSEHEHVWQYCSIGGSDDPIIRTPIPFCAQTPNVEQRYQMSWFGTHVVPGLKRPFPKYLDCVHLPPAGYTWPDKYPQLPATEAAVHWPNFRVASHKELVVFNEATPKNLYHFDAPKYDKDALGELSWAAKYIPFGPKIRNMLDVGAGGGSLGLLMHRKYDVQVLSTVFADWPYCEYITERGGLCMLVDVMEPMPFAKFTFDVIHVSWVFHGQQPEELIVMFNEINRIIRPGGYLWMRGGWSKRQVAAMQQLLGDKFGYSVLVQEEKKKPAEVTARLNFGENMPYEEDWNVLMVKPIHAQLAAGCTAQVA